MTLQLRNPRTSEIKHVKAGWSWTSFFFNQFFGIPLFLRGLVGLGVAAIGIQVVGILLQLYVQSETFRTEVLAGVAEPDAVQTLQFATLGVYGAFWLLILGFSIYCGVRANKLFLIRLLDRGWIPNDTDTTPSGLQAGEVKYCAKCGAAVGSDRFCGSCGAPISVSSVVARLVNDDPGQNAAMRMLLPVGRSGYAIAAGYLGLFAVLLFAAPFALIFGILGVRDIKKNPLRHGMGRSVFGIVMGSLGTIGLVAIAVPFLMQNWRTSTPLIKASAPTAIASTGSASPSQPTPAAVTPVSSSEPVPMDEQLAQLSHAADRWVYEEPIDKVTGNKDYDATRTVPLENGGQAQMTAHCVALSNLFGGKLTFGGIDIVFFDRKGEGIGVDDNGFDADGGGRLRYSTKTGSEETMWVQLLHKNEIQVRGLNQIEVPNFGRDSDSAKPMFGAGVAREFVNAPFARLEIPLLDSEKPVIDLKPQDEDLRKVIRRCLPAAL
jgi:hypothetical protein